MKLRSVLLATALLAAAPAQAVEVLDQNHLQPVGSYNGAQVYASGTLHPFALSSRSAAEAGQTFTAGLPGVLSRIDLMIGFTEVNTIKLWLRSVSGGIIDPDNANALASFDLLAPQWDTAYTYTVTSIDVSSAGLTVIPGQQYAITLSSDNAIFGGWAGQGDDYAGGTGWGRDSATAAWNWPIGTNGDLYFATYVNQSTAAVPEPATWAMMLTGFGAIGFAMRRRRAQRPNVRFAF